MIYEVLRDGAPLVTTDGTSWFDDTLAPARRYVYDVVAVDREGRRSSASPVALTTLGGDENPFAEPDPDGTTTIARLGYPAVRDLADDLVSTGYLALYYDTERALRSLLQGGSPADEGFAIGCPEGGSASGSHAIFTFDVVLDDCVIDGVTLSGGLVFESEFVVFGLGGSRTATVTFDGLVIEAGEAGRLSVSGASTRTYYNLANTECSGAPTITRTVDNRIDTARFENATGAASTSSAASWTQSRARGVQRTSADFSDPCTAFETLSFDGEATISSTRFSDDDPATLGKQCAGIAKAERVEVLEGRWRSAEGPGRGRDGVRIGGHRQALGESGNRRREGKCSPG